MRKRVLIGGIAVLGLLLLLMSMGSFADNPQDISVSAQVGAVVRLSMTPTTIDWGGAALEPGTSYDDTTVATVSSNKGWNLDVEADQLLTGVVDAETIPSANFTFETTSSDGRVTYKAPAGTEFSVGSGTNAASGDRGGSIDMTMTYSLDVPWDLAPDTYTATHTYTASQI